MIWAAYGCGVAAGLMAIGHAAALLGPWLAGQIYDWTGNYTTALWLAAGLRIISAVTAPKIIWTYLSSLRIRASSSASSIPNI